jgi:hypothetical protein
MGIIGAILYRMRGGFEPLGLSFPRPIEQILFCLPLAACAWQNSAWDFALLSLVVAVAMCCEGHGSYMALGRQKIITNVDDEFFKPAVRLLTLYQLEPKDYLYQFIGLAVTGVAVTALPAYFAGSWWLVLAGLAKPLCYEAGLRLKPYFRIMGDTQEASFGFVVWFVAGLVLLCT